VGDEAYRPFDVRVLAATNRNLDAEVTAGRFRADLLHRLAVVRVRLPPLRERPDDIPLLTRKFLESMGRKGAGFAVSPQTLSSLQGHRWPGNVRELRNLIERAVALSGESGPIDATALGLKPGAQGEAAVNDYRVARENALAAFERDFVVHLLRRFDKNVTKAAKEAGIDRVYLHRLIKKHNVPVDEL
jgi:DNA-binding NtrC family response regulator